MAKKQKTQKKQKQMDWATRLVLTMAKYGSVAYTDPAGKAGFQMWLTQHDVPGLEATIKEAREGVPVDHDVHITVVISAR